MRKMSKQVAGYVNQADKEKILMSIGGCKNCKHYTPETYTCAIVSGKIMPDAGCNYFTKKI